MSFNLGAFAGGLAQGGINTYRTLSEIESQKKRDEMLELQKQELKDRLDEAAAIKQLNKDTYGRVGQDSYAKGLQDTTGIGQQQARALDVNSGDADFDRAVAQSSQGVLRENAQRQGAALPAQTEMAPTKYTQDQATADYVTRLRAINPEKAMQHENLGLQLKGAQRSEKRSQAEDDFSEWMQGAVKQAQADPVQFVRDHLNDYNKPRPGSRLDDKMTGEVVAGADGKSFSFVQKDAKGKVVASTPITTETAMAGLKEIAFNRYTALPGKFKEGMELGLRQEEVGYKGREVGVKEALLPSEIAKNNAAANQANAHAGVFNNMLTVAKQNQEAGAAMKPFIDQFAALTPEQQAGPEGQAILLKGAVAGAQKSKDMASLVATLQKPNRSVVSAEHEKAAYADLQNAGTDPKAIKAVKAKWPEVFGPSALDKAIEAKTKEGKNGGGAKTDTAKTDSEKPTSALPIKNSEFAVSGGRGQYKVSGIPQTFRSRAEAEKAAEKAILQSRNAEVQSALDRDQ